MKLLYLWVQEYSLFHNREFHFSDEYHFHFNCKTNILDCQRNDRYPAEIYHTQNVGQISCIIGDNGQGKTTLLKLLMTALPYQAGLNGFDPIQCVYVLKADDGDEDDYTIRTSQEGLLDEDGVTDGIYIYTSLAQIHIQAQSSINIKNSTNSTIFRMAADSGNFLRCGEMKHTAVVFHSNIFDRDRYNLQDAFYGVEDISFNGLLRTDFEFRTTDFNTNAGTQLRIYLDADMIRQIHFIFTYQNTGFDKWISFPLPKRLNYIFREEENMLSSVYQYDRNTLSVDERHVIYDYEREFSFHRWTDYNTDQLQEIAAHICKDIVKLYNKCFRQESDRFRYKMNRGILMSVIRCVFPETVGKGTSQKIKKLIWDLRSFLAGYTSKQTKFAYMNDRHGDSQDFVEQFIYITELKDIDGLLEAVVRLNQGILRKEFGIVHAVGDTFYMEVHSHEKMLTEIYKDIRTTALGYDYLVFRWDGLSSGEYNLLSLYARIYSLQEKLQNFSSLMFLIDEADLSYHPRWQQEYIFNLVSFLNHIYPVHQIQLIIATHSPIILSDVLKGNVVFLSEKGEVDMENTFGANIYDLYRDGMFFGKGNMGIIGAYADQKIREAVARLEECDLNQADNSLLYEIEKLVDCIGEPVIRKMLTHRIDQQKEKLHLDKRDQGEEAFLLVQENLKKLGPEFLDKAADVIEELRGK